MQVQKQVSCKGAPRVRSGSGVAWQAQCGASHKETHKHYSADTYGVQEVGVLQEMRTARSNSGVQQGAAM
jgi:hypothetical protein